MSLPVPGSELPERCRVAIVGSGPAGSALAALLARGGESPVLLEQDVLPRPKLCGEFLSPEAQGLLQAVGCLDPLRALRPAVMTSGRFFAPSGRRVEFGLGGEALGLSRLALDDALLRHAARCGARTFEGTKVTRILPIAGATVLDFERRRPDGSRETGRLRAEQVVGAYGRRSALDHGLARRFLRRRHRFVGLKRLHRLAPGADAVAAELRGRVEIHLFDGGYCGLSFVEEGAVNVCLLAENRVLESFASPRWADVAAGLRRLSPSLRGRFEALRPHGEPLAVAALSFEAKETSSGPVLFAGDAAGMIAPLCGDGQAMALESAVLLADLLTHGGAADLSNRWDGLWRGRFAARLRTGRWLQRALLQPRAAEFAVALAARWPALVQALVAATRGQWGSLLRKQDAVY